MDRIKFIGPSVLLAAVTLGVLLAGPGVMRRLAHAETAARVDASREQLREQTISLNALNDAFRAVSAAVEPSVVNIAITQDAPERLSLNRRLDLRDLQDELQRIPESQRPSTRGEIEEFLRDRFFGQGGGEGAPGEVVPFAPQEDDRFDEFDRPDGQRGNGSGWVYEHSDGRRFIVTNNHVVDGASQIVVEFFDGSERVAEVVGADPRTDIAVLRADYDGMHPALVASEPAQQGDIVFAFGSPLGFEFSISQGIVSAKGRELGILSRQGGYENFIQTDAAINQGNSGGPLTNIRGEVVGMNTAIYSINQRSRLDPEGRPTGFLGVGFAIPTEMILGVVNDLVEGGEVRRGFLGITMNEDLSLDMARTFGYPHGSDGVLVDDALPGFPAADAGIRPGDIVMELNGERVRSNSELRYKVSSIKPGEDIDVKLWRWDAGAGEGGERMMTVRLAELTDTLTGVVPGVGGGVFGEDGEVVSERLLEPLYKLGLTEFTTMSEAITERYGRAVPDTPGVLLESVRRRSIAYEAGLRNGMVVTSVQGVAVSAAGEMVEEINKHDLTAGVRLRVRGIFNGGERSVYVMLRLPQR